ncbi:hypothetical protein D3C81_1136610 [compost metagenome]
MVYFHESTKVIKISVAGLSTGLPIQKARLAPTDTFCLRKPHASGAAQQVHIIPGREAAPPSKVLLKLLFPNTLYSHLPGRRTCTNEPSKMPNIAAFHTDLKYVIA